MMAETCSETATLCNKLPATKYHPSTRTNINIFNGKDISTGGNINIPIDTSKLDTSKSMTINGK